MIWSEQQGNDGTRLHISGSIGYARINIIGDLLRLITEKAPVVLNSAHQRSYVDELTFSKALADACPNPLALLGC